MQLKLSLYQRAAVLCAEWAKTAQFCGREAPKVEAPKVENYLDSFESVGYNNHRNEGFVFKVRRRFI